MKITRKISKIIRNHICMIISEYNHKNDNKTKNTGKNNRINMIILVKTSKKKQI